MIAPQHYSDDEIAKAKREAVLQLLDGWVGPTAADVISCGLRVPVHLIEPQLGCGDHNSLITSSLSRSHGVHLCPPPTEWDGAAGDFTLECAPRLAQPIVLMHVLFGSDAHDSLLGGAQFNHWVPLLLGGNFVRRLPMSSRGEVDVDSIQLYRPTLITRATTRDQAAQEEHQVIDLTVTSSHTDRSVHSPLPNLADSNVQEQELGCVTSTTVDDHTWLPCLSQTTGSSASPVACVQAQPSEDDSEYVDVTADFSHILEKAFQSAEECIKELRAVSERQRCGLLFNRAKVS
jgi:hypothetical protein